jgi:membrane protease YdiL (CAAX protease family)
MAAALAFNERAKRLLLTGLLIIVAMLVASVALVHVIRNPPPPLYTPLTAIGFFIVVVFVNPTVEEIFFRGLMTSLLERFTGFWPASVIASAAWTACHLMRPLPPTSLAMLLVLGLIFSAMLRKTGSLWPCIIGHSCVNSAQASFAVALALAQ